MNEDKDQAVQDFKEKHYGWGNTPISILTNLNVWITGIGFDLPEITSEEIYKEIQDGCKEKDGGTIKINSPGVYENSIEEYFSEWQDEGFAELRGFIENYFSYNSRRIYELFSNTPIFLTILESVSILRQIYESLKQATEQRFISEGFSCFSEEDVIKYFGEWARKHYQPGKILVEEDYKEILEEFCEFLDYINENNYLCRLHDLAMRIDTYIIYFLEGAETEKIEVDLAAFQKQTGGHIRLLRDLESVFCGKDVSLVPDKHGIDGVKTLKTALREKGYETLARQIHRRKRGKGYTVKCTATIKLIE